MLTPPTDSLYKFFAVAGLIMILWGAAYPWTKSYETKLESAQLQAQIKAVDEKAKQLQAEYEELTRAQQIINKSSSNDIEKQEIRVKKRDLYIKLIEVQHPVDSGLERLSVIEEATVTYRWLGWISISVGGVLMAIGFIAWYFRIQRYVDRDIRSFQKHSQVSKE